MTALLKDAVRTEARARRREAHARVDPGPALTALAGLLALHPGRAVAGYVPIGSEIDPLPALGPFAATRPLCLPVTHGRGRPLSFRFWTPGASLEAAGFGTRAPGPEAPGIVPQILVVPMLAFDRQGGRMGYGAGHYDCTLAALRPRDPGLLAVGFAYAAQEFDRLPQEPTDQRLDLIVTEAGVIVPEL